MVSISCDNRFCTVTYHRSNLIMKKIIFCLSFFIISADVSANTKYHYGLHVDKSDYSRLIGDFAFGANVGARLELPDSPLSIVVDISPRLERFHRYDEDDGDSKLLGFDSIMLSSPIRFLFGVGSQNAPVSFGIFGGMDPWIQKWDSDYATGGGLILGPSLSMASGGMKLEVAASYWVRDLFYFNDGINAWPWDDRHEFTWPWDDRSYSEIWINLVMAR